MATSVRYAFSDVSLGYFNAVDRAGFLYFFIYAVESVDALQHCCFEEFIVFNNWSVDACCHPCQA
ncbi:hypothetical protein [Pseudomonas viridiflava]|uniref:hypothetical protein n=1 Tax=Pseudomonas viridiflava TaxID=33069 RepID=UPI0013CE7480|nr:hypothetical protein [Pseudomonas viridiflava]